MKVGLFIGKVEKFGISWCFPHRMAVDNAKGGSGQAPPPLGHIGLISHQSQRSRACSIIATTFRGRENFQKTNNKYWDRNLGYDFVIFPNRVVKYKYPGLGYVCKMEIL